MPPIPLSVPPLCQVIPFVPCKAQDMKAFKVISRSMSCKLSKPENPGTGAHFIYFMVCFLLKSYHLWLVLFFINILMRSNNEAIGTDTHMYWLDLLNENFFKSFLKTIALDWVIWIVWVWGLKLRGWDSDVLGTEMNFKVAQRQWQQVPLAQETKLRRHVGRISLVFTTEWRFANIMSNF